MAVTKETANIENRVLKRSRYSPTMTFGINVTRDFTYTRQTQLRIHGDEQEDGKGNEGGQEN